MVSVNKKLFIVLLVLAVVSMGLNFYFHYQLKEIERFLDQVKEFLLTTEKNEESKKTVQIWNKNTPHFLNFNARRDFLSLLYLDYTLLLKSSLKANFCENRGIFILIRLSSCVEQSRWRLGI